MVGRSSKRTDTRGRSGGPTPEQQAEIELQEWRERHLPWEAENKVIAMFSILKVPLIFFVGFFGIIAERQVKDLTLETWSRSVLSGQPSCYIHRLDMARAPKHTEWSFVQYLNDTFMGGRLGEPKKLTVADLTLELAGRDLCGFDEHCHPDSTVHNNRFETGGVQHGFSFALLWTFYKLAFIGVHPLDRTMVRILGWPPLLKLLTEPYFQPPCTKPMALMVKFFFYVRYKLMPNLLLASFASLETHPACKDLVFYKMDWFWGNVMYYAICMDLFWTFLLYGLGIRWKVALVGTWKYRMYKVYWFFSGFFPGIFVFFDVMTTSQWNIFRLIRFTFRCVFTFDITFAFYIDFLQLFLFCIGLFEFLEFVAFVCQILCPKVVERQPWFKAMDFEWCDAAPKPVEEAELETLVDRSSYGDPVLPPADSRPRAAAPAADRQQQGPQKQLGHALKGLKGMLSGGIAKAAGAGASRPGPPGSRGSGKGRGRGGGSRSSSGTR